MANNTRKAAPERQLRHIRQIIRTGLEEGERLRSNPALTRSTSYRQQLVAHSETLLRINEYLSR